MKWIPKTGQVVKVDAMVARSKEGDIMKSGKELS